MSQKKVKRNKGGNKQSKRKVPDLDVQAGEGYYGTVEKVLGHNIISVKLNDNTTRQAKIPGKFLKRVWLRAGTKVLLNTDLEVVNIIRDTDVKSAEADRMLRNAGHDGNNIFQNYSDSEEDEEDEEESAEPIRKLENIGKTKELLVKKEKDKAKDFERKSGRVVRSADEIEKEMSEILPNKKECTEDDTKISTEDEINIDNI